MTTEFVQHMDKDESWLTASNDRFPAEKEHWVRGLLHDAKVDLELLDEEILKVQEVANQLANQLNSLLERREHKAGRIRTIQGSISALKRIPPEVLAEIFIHSVNPPHAIIIPIEGDFHPWVLGQVCSRWRQIAWKTPHLWNSFYILEDAAGGKNPAAYILNEILLKTTATFSIHINTQQLMPILETLIPFQRRLKDMEIRKVEFLDFQSVVDFAPALMRLLTTLGLTIEEDILPSSSNEVVPNLRSFSVVTSNWVTTSGVLSQLSFCPWEKLTNLSISDIQIPMTQAHDLLRECTSVVQCTLKTVCCYIEASSTQSIILPHLEDFHLKFRVDDEGASVENFMELLILPSLSDLAMTGFFPEEGVLDSWPPSIISLVSRSGCAIKALSISSVNGMYSESGNEGIDAVMKALPSLEEFECDFYTPPIFFESMQTQNLLPKLNKITTCLSAECFEAMVNLLDSYIDPLDSARSRGSIISFVIFMDPDAYSSEVVNEYWKKEHIYFAAGINVNIRSFGYALVSALDIGSEYSDEDGNEGDGLGWEAGLEEGEGVGWEDGWG